MVRKLTAWRCAGVVALTALGGTSGCFTTGVTESLPKGPLAVSSSTPTLDNHQIADVQIAAAQVLEKRGDATGALAKYREALERDPQRTDATLRVAILLDKNGKFAEAQEAYRKALAARPDSADINCCYGYSLYLQEQFEEAEKFLRKAISLDADHARAHNNLGLLLAQTGRNDEALVAFRKGGCSEADARANIAFARTLQGDLGQAKEQYQRSLTLDPSAVATRKRLEELNTLSTRAEERRIQTAERGALAP